MQKSSSHVWDVLWPTSISRKNKRLVCQEAILTFGDHPLRPCVYSHPLHICSRSLPRAGAEHMVGYLQPSPVLTLAS